MLISTLVIGIGGGFGLILIKNNNPSLNHGGNQIEIGAAKSQGQSNLKSSVDGFDDKTIVGKNEDILLDADAILKLPNDDPRKKNLLLKIKLRDVPTYIREHYASLAVKLNLNQDDANNLLNMIVLRSLLIDEALSYIQKTAVYIDYASPGQLLNGKTLFLHLSGNTGDISHVVQDEAAAGALVDVEVKKLLGDDEKYTEYLKSVGMYYIQNRADGINYEFNLAHIAKMTDAQLNDFVDILFTENPKNMKYNVITDTVINVSSRFLDPSQIAVLKSIQARESAKDEAVALALKNGSYYRPK